MNPQPPPPFYPPESKTLQEKSYSQHRPSNHQQQTGSYAFPQYSSTTIFPASLTSQVHPPPPQSFPPLSFAGYPTLPSGLEKRSKAIPIINPQTRKEVTKDIPRDRIGLLDKNAPEFKPKSKGSLVVSTTSLPFKTNKNDLCSTKSTTVDQHLPLGNVAGSISSIIAQIPKSLEQNLINDGDEQKQIEQNASNEPRRGRGIQKSLSYVNRRLSNQQYSKDEFHRHLSPRRHKNPHRREAGLDAINQMKISIENDSVNKEANLTIIEKMDQQCTVHLTLDEITNKIVDGSSGEKKNEEKSMESSMDTGFKYGMDELRELKKSPNVIKNPPKLKSNLLHKKLPSVVWRTLFDKTYNEPVEDANDTLNASYSRNQKRSQPNLRETQSCSARFKPNSPEKNLIKVTLSSSNVPLNEADDAWKPSHLKVQAFDDDADSVKLNLNRNFRSMLNKITAENFDHLLKELRNVKKYPINSMDKLKMIVDLLFEKSIAEPGFASIYAHLCKELSDVHIFQVNEELLTSNIGKTRNPWKLSLITRCQEEFERCAKDKEVFLDIQEKISTAANNEERDSFEEIYYKVRQRANGTVKFIGELYKHDLLTSKIMRSCVSSLLNSVTEENIERLCKLLTTVGLKLQKESEKSQIDFYMQKLLELKQSNVIKTSRIKFDIMNVLDMRKAQWVPRANARLNEANPKTMQQLADEDQKEKKQKAVQLLDYKLLERTKKNNINNNNQDRSTNGKNKIQQPQVSFSNQLRPNISLNKLNLPRREESVNLGGQAANLFQNFTNQKAISVINPYASLPIECDDTEMFPASNRERPAAANHQNELKSKNHEKDISPSIPSNIEEKIELEEKNVEEELMAELSEVENSTMRLFEQNLNELMKGKISMEQLTENIDKLQITNTILEQVYNVFLDKKKREREEFINVIICLLQKKMLTKNVHIDAFESLLKTLPDLIVDVPLVYEYAAGYCIQFINANQMSIKNVEDFCKNKETNAKILNYVHSNLPTQEDCHNFEKNVSKSKTDKLHEIVDTLTANDTRKDLPLDCTISNNVGSSVSTLDSIEKAIISNAEVTNINAVEMKSENCSKSKSEKSLRSMMKFLNYQLKKQKPNYLKEISEIIDSNKHLKDEQFIQELTLTVLQIHSNNNLLGKKPKMHLSDWLVVLKGYIDNDLTSQMQCISVIKHFAFKHDKQSFCHLFDIFYENDVISIEALKQWRDETPKDKQIKFDAVLLAKLEEIDN